MTLARKLHVDDALAGLPFVATGPVVDVGSGGGSPGLPLAVARPELAFDLLESARRKCDFLESVAPSFPNVRVVRARAEDWGRTDGRDAYAVAVARALAPQAVAAEWCLPLVRPGGLLVLYAGEPVAGLDRVAEALAAARQGPLPSRKRTGEPSSCSRSSARLQSAFPAARAGTQATPPVTFSSASGRAPEPADARRTLVPWHEGSTLI